MAEKNILLEIGSEEIPARFMPGALEGLKACAITILNNNQVVFDEKNITVLGTPRRLTLHIARVIDRIEQPVLGPPRKIALDAEGNYTKAAYGFAKRCGKSLDDFEFIDNRLGYMNVVEAGAVKGLLADICKEIIKSLTFPKTMRWGNGDFKFVRPIHWIAALFGKDTIKFEIAGIKSNNKSRGHRFLAPDNVTLANADLESYNLESYKKILKEKFVVVDQDKRKSLIRERLQKVVKDNCRVVMDEELLEEVNYLVEYPVALRGTFDSEFLDLPREVLIDCMRQHQKYFVVEHENGELENTFVVVANLPDNEENLIRSGNERVLRARLADAQYFYEEDKKIGLEARVEGLKGVVYQKDLGSYYDKKERVKALLKNAFLDHIDYTGEAYDINKAQYERVADLYKADLLTEIVQEFPKLQGIMGEQYARLEGKPEEVAVAIREHYLPRFAGDRLPDKRLGKILSVADKLDTIVGCFGVGLIPSGSQDPYALRRQALGVVNVLQILLNGKWSLATLIDESLKTLSPRIKRSPEEVKKEVMEFFRQRLCHLLSEKGYRYDLVEAALGAGFEYPVEVEARCRALQDLKAESDWEPLVTAFKRVAKIIPQDRRFNSPNENLFQEEAEKDLYLQFNQCQQAVDDYVNNERYLEALKELAALRPAVDRFFDEVMVMCEDEELQNNRLALLNSIAGKFNQIVDFSKIVTQDA